MNNKITLKRIESFEVFSGEASLGIFKVESEWNGLTKMVSDKRQIIVSRDFAPINQVFGIDTDAKIIQASPSVWDQIVKLEKP